MSFGQDLKCMLEDEERRTVGDAFGGSSASARASFSVASIAAGAITAAESASCPIHGEVESARALLGKTGTVWLVRSLIRYSFLIELTNLTVGSTKMKTRWLPGKILMPQASSYEPIKGTFKPGNDPRSATFDACFELFVSGLRTLLEEVDSGNIPVSLLDRLRKHNSVPYEIPIDYVDVNLDPVHAVNNVAWCPNEDIEWLVQVRKHLRSVIPKATRDKVCTKAYKTDRSLTGKDKTNRARRWEVLSGDFQHASLTECWSVERRLLHDLATSKGFPSETKRRLVNDGLVEPGELTRCPVTLEVLPFEELVSTSSHGISAYQIGHLTPLKRGGRHTGENVAWLSADGNRIQGDLTLAETVKLLGAIEERRRKQP